MAVRWASDPVLDFQSSYAGSIPVVRSKKYKSIIMARKVYHIPLVKLRVIEVKLIRLLMIRAI